MKVHKMFTLFVSIVGAVILTTSFVIGFSVYEDDDFLNYKVITKDHEIDNNEFLNEHRIKRSMSGFNGHKIFQEQLDSNKSNKTIQPERTPYIKVNELLDSHQQLIVHWAGERSSVIYCLARDPRESVIRGKRSKPSTIYISYDYGESFENKSTALKNEKPMTVLTGTIEKFIIHPRFSSICIFINPENRRIHWTDNSGHKIQTSYLNMYPSEVSFHPILPRTYLILDKEDPLNKLYITNDLGKSYELLEEFVKHFDFAYLHNNEEIRTLVVQRFEPSLGMTTITALHEFLNVSKKYSEQLLDEVEDFSIKGKYMFATKRMSKTHKDLYISYRHNPFIKAKFPGELDFQDYHIADISEQRMFIAVAHSESVCNLYISDIIDLQKQEAIFYLSLERVLCHFTNITWKQSLISDMADVDFIDLHKVEGLRGIYIASQVLSIPNNSSNVAPEHLTTVITFDWGVRWRPLNVTYHMNTVPCNISDGCSLQLSQKFALWYPSTRYSPILSSKSAPGFIIATGVFGKSLKGHPAVFMSRDAGLTWRQILKENYFYNMGDQGGIIVAYKFYKSKEEANEILYSIDEGETFHSYVLESKKPLKIYSLMTEPGENTTIFSLFGSGTAVHEWTIIKADFHNVFPTICNDSDYKIWSPTATDDPKKMCILGRTEMHRRRISHAKCHNGYNNTTLTILINLCDCDESDFMCDIGFHRDDHLNQCVHLREANSDPYKIPEHCPAYSYYNRTKGYRKIPLDMCINGDSHKFLPDRIPCPVKEKREFMLLAQKDKIVSFSLVDSTSSDVLPLEDLQNVIAIEFDIKNNCVYYADIVDDSIGRLCLEGKPAEILVHSHLQSVEGMSLDWTSNHLYFVDGVRKKIEVIKTDCNSTTGHMRKTILDSKILKKPRGIITHPMAGYIFWTDWDSEDACIGRANLDGVNPIKLFKKPVVEWPNGITIDFITDRIYWVDAKMDYIAFSDLQGNGFKKIIQQISVMSHPFSLAIFKDSVYFDDWKQNAIFVADKNYGAAVNVFQNKLPGLMDLKVFSHSSQQGTNKCTNNTECSHLCFGTPGNQFTCSCPDGLKLNGKSKCICPGGQAPLKNDTCLPVGNTCATDYFQCKNNLCIPNLWKCDGDDDCGDGSDEVCDTHSTCAANMFQCGSGRCIPSYWKCDFDPDCEDGSDEKNCTYSTCNPADQFTCDNGRCISKRWRCDMEDDCRDFSDERNCTFHEESAAHTCETNDFKCHNIQQCIPFSWICDGDHDCNDGSDEINCQPHKCESWQFQCNNSKCIFHTWVCDGEDDCNDGQRSDELNCNKTSIVPTTTEFTPIACQSWMFQCGNKKCIPYWWKCDRVNDCKDGTDELGCFPTESDSPNTVQTSTEPISASNCQDHQFRCLTGDCIMDSWVCDGIKDCDGGEDEKNCNDTTSCSSLAKPHFRCRTFGACIPLSHVCDGKAQCPDGSDEGLCYPKQYNMTSINPNCDVGYFPCDGNKCLPLIYRCNNRHDCLDGTDEIDCSGIYFQIILITINKVTTNSILISWYVHPLIQSSNIAFLPSIAESNVPGSWTNKTWIANTNYQFTGLDAYKKYNMTVYIRDKSTGRIFPASYYIQRRTAEGVPSAPVKVTATHIGSDQILVTWLPSEHPEGEIQEYVVIMTPPFPPIMQSVPANETKSVLTVDPQPNTTFTIWVRAKNNLNESVNSEPAYCKFDESSIFGGVRNLTVESVTENTVTLNWLPIRSADEYQIFAHVMPPYPMTQLVKTTFTKYTVTGLSPGVNYTIEVVPYSSADKFVGRSSVVYVTTQGEQLPVIANISSKVQRNIVTLNWTRPNNTEHIKKIKYGIYYGTTLRELFRGAKLTTDTFIKDVTDLGFCRSFLFSVGILSDYGIGPLRSPLSIMTQYNPVASPRNLRILPDPVNHTRAIVAWSASCEIMTPPIGYIVQVKDIVSGKLWKIIQIDPTDQTELNATIEGVHGAEYDITVHTTADSATDAFSVKFKAASLPIPHQVVAHFTTDGQAHVFWECDNIPETVRQNGYTFVVEVHMKNGTNMEKFGEFEKDQPPYSITDKMNSNVTYVFQVKMKSLGHLSEPSEAYYGNIPPPGLWNSDQYTSSKTATQVGGGSSFSISVMLIIILIVGLVGFGYWKYVKHQPSFRNLVNSHYNTRSGSATFTGVDGLDDTPDIRECFSDDEPLVVA